MRLSCLNEVWVRNSGKGVRNYSLSIKSSKQFLFRRKYSYDNRIHAFFDVMTEIEFDNNFISQLKILYYEEET